MSILAGAADQETIDEAEGEQTTLFPSPGVKRANNWLEALLVSTVMERQRSRAGSRAPSEERVRTVLVALIGNGDRLTHVELADATGFARVRIGGLVASISRLLNVDGYAVLDDDGELVSLDQELARTQFGVG